VTQVEPDHITLALQPKAEQTVPVHVQVEGEPTLGYFKRAAVVNPREVKVSGPSTYVAQVVEAAAKVSVEDATADIEGQFQLQPLDSEGRPVPYVKLALEGVDVRIPIELSTYYRPLAVKVTLEGQIAYGYRITEISVEPPSVTASGLPSIIAALPGFIETEPISIEGAQADVVERPALNIPSEVSVVMDEQPVVRVSIEAIQSSLTVVITPQIQGLDPGYSTTISPETVEVILSGPLPVLETLEDDDVRILLDLFGLPSGTHQIEPQIVAPESVTAQSINPATIQVAVAIMPTSTPTED
jgi:YbbR domain-containing protein